MNNHQPTQNLDLRKGAVTRTGVTLLSFVHDGKDDGETWRVRDEADIERNMTVYPEDVTGYSNRLYL